MKKIHEFDNGVKVFDEQLLDIQRERYKKRNVHEEDEEDVFTSLIKGLPQGAIYVNVGTAIGYYPLLARRLRSDLLIYCFEPLTRHLKYFRDNIALNCFNKEDFKVYSVAISTHSGKADFVDNSYGSSLYSGVKSGVIAKKPKFQSIKAVIKRLLGITLSENRITVDSLRLSDIFHLIQKEKVDLLQMDIQGFEKPVMKAYFSNTNPIDGQIIQFLVGTHGNDIHEGCRDCLEKNGYQILHDEQNTQHQPDGILLGSLA